MDIIEVNTDISEVCRAFGHKIIDEKGLHPTPGGSSDQSGNWLLLALDMSAEEVMDKGLSLCRDAAVSEFFISFDCNNRPDRAATHHSVLVIFHVRKGEACRLAVMEYGWDSGEDVPIIKEVIWDDAFWCNHYSAALNRLAEESSKPATWCSTADTGDVALVN